MAFTIDIPGGWYDIPDSVFDAGSVATEDILVALNSLVRFAAVCDEYFPTAQYPNGGTIGLPQSADDGYAYARSEALYAAAMVFSPNPNTGTNGGNGDLLYIYDYVEQDSGAVHSAVNYYVQGGQESTSQDGLTSAIICCRRGAGAKAAHPGTPGAPNGPTGGGPAGGGGNPTGGGRYPYGPQGDQGGQGDPLVLGHGKLTHL